MKFSRRTNTIILWIISLALLIGMVITFTPSFGNLFQQNADTQGTVALRVNGEPITELAVARAQQSPLYQTVREGEVGDDLELLLLDSLIDREVLRQAASGIRVSNGDVRQAVDDFRRNNGVAGRDNDSRYLSLIGSAGYDDASFRAALQEQLRVQRFQDRVTEDVAVSDAEIEAYYNVNQQNYETDPRIVARMITVDDADLAADLRVQLGAGADFAQLASENSVERADRGGALGAGEGETDPRPVGRAALPTAVAQAAFGLAGPGLTDVVESGGRSYIVQVEQYLEPEVQPLADVRDEVEADALSAKQQAVLENEVDRLRSEATVTVPEESSYSFDDRVVARVGDVDIMRTDLVRATYTNPQIQQALSPQTADLIAGFFKSSMLAQLIDVELAYQGSKDLGPEFIGSKSLIAQQAINYVTRDAEATDEEIQAYYESNPSRYTVPASAVATRVDFASEADATAFRAALLDGDGVESAAEALGGTVDDLGTVAPGQLQGELDTALFGSDAFEDLPASSDAVSDVLVLEQTVDTSADASSTGDAASQPGDTGVDQAEPGSGSAPAVTQTYVVLVADRTPETLRPLSEVRDDVASSVLTQERSTLREEWLSSLQDQIEVVNLLDAPAGDASGDAPADGADASTSDAGAADPAAADGAADSGEAAPSDGGDAAPADGGN